MFLIELKSLLLKKGIWIFFLMETAFWMYFAVEIEFVSSDQKLLVANWDLSTLELKIINELFLNRYTLTFHKLFNINAIAHGWIVHSVQLVIQC